MKQRSAGLLLFRRKDPSVEFFLVHPGGPFWAKKDDGAWSIPKGLYTEGEPPLEAAKREYTEETGFSVEGSFLELGEFKQPSGKNILAWLVEGDCVPEAIKSNVFSMEWPPRSGKTSEFPEVDRAAWLVPHHALRKILPGQRAIIERAVQELGITVEPELTVNEPPPKQKPAQQGSLL